MPFDVDALLPLAEGVKPRAPREWREGVWARCAVFRQPPELREPVPLDEGPFKWSHEEISPLRVFAVRRYDDRDDVLCVPKYQTGDVDAEVREPSRTIRVEITGARDPSEHLRMAYLVEHGRVSLTGGLKVQGTKRTGRQIENAVEFEGHREARARHLGWIKAAAKGKAGGGRYGKTSEPLAAGQDSWVVGDGVPDVSDLIVGLGHG